MAAGPYGRQIGERHPLEGGDRSAPHSTGFRLREALGDPAGLAECFPGLADDLALRGRYAEADVLLDAAERVEVRRRNAGVPVTGPDRPSLEDVLGLELGLEPATG